MEIVNCMVKLFWQQIAVCDNIKWTIYGHQANIFVKPNGNWHYDIE